MLTQTVIKQRIKKTFGLTGTGTGGDDGRTRCTIGTQPLPGQFLVGIRRMIGAETGKEIAAGAALQER
jgi:hypothetical protein